MKMWNTTNKGVYVKGDDSYTRISSIDMTKQIFDLSNRSNIQSYKITSLNPNLELIKEFKELRF